MHVVWNCAHQNQVKQLHYTHTILPIKGTIIHQSIYNIVFSLLDVVLCVIVSFVTSELFAH